MTDKWGEEEKKQSAVWDLLRRKHFCSWRANIWRWLHLTTPVCLHVTVQRTDDPDWWSLSHLEKISGVLNTSLLSTRRTRDAGEQKKKRGREIKKKVLPGPEPPGRLNAGCGPECFVQHYRQRLSHCPLANSWTQFCEGNLVLKKKS